MTGLLAAAAVAGCNRKPSGNPPTAGTNLQTAAIAPGAPAIKPAAAPGISNSIPLRTILSLHQAGSRTAGGALVRVRGTVLDEQPGEYIVVHDQTGTILAETHQTLLPGVEDVVDLQGQPDFDGAYVSLKNAVAVSTTTNGAINPEESVSSTRPASLPVLTNVWQVRDLPPEKAAWHYPVRLRAVVTVNAHYQDYFFAQDNSAGISIRMPGISTSTVKPGDWVNIEGVSDPGGFSPIVLASNVTVLGTVPLPRAQPETLFQLATGQEGSQWIEVRGVVRSLTFTNGMAQLNLRDINGTIPVNVPAEHEPVNLLDAVVRIKGACGTLSVRRQMTGFILWVSSLADVQIEEPGVSDPLNQPVQPIATLDQFHPRQTLQHRISIGGIVTFVDTNLNFFFIQDADSGVRVETAGNRQVKPGDYVIASGYPGLGSYGNLLQNAVFKVISQRQMPPPRPISKNNPIDPRLHDRWVQAEARFLHYSKIGDVDTLTLQIGNKVFDVRIITPVSARIKNLESGSLLQIAGIYRVLSDEARVPKSLQLAVPSEQEIQVLEEPTWWTVEHTAMVVGVMAVIIGATALWVLLLGRKVRQQTASLRQSEGKFRSLVEQSLVGVYILQNDRFVYANPRLAEIFGHRPEELAAPLKLDDVILPEDLALVREQIRRWLAGETDATHHFARGRRKDGSLIHLEMLGSRTEFGGRPAVLGTVMDVTERKSVPGQNRGAGADAGPGQRRHHGLRSQ